MGTAVRVEDVSKKYCRTLKHTMLYGIADLAAGFCNYSQRDRELRPGEFWAIDGVSFSVEQGETIGVIGTNGSGKSTLLKMLSGIFMPDRGRIEISGKTGALIEVGAGFHPLLTGRENIYVNGAIYGMSKAEIDLVFKEIVDFAGIGDFLDAPVKHYSSGMYVRLGFAIAIHCKPDILLIDEVLAVGDLSFRLKCIERIKEIQQEGKTIFYVTHDLTSVKKLCTRTVWLNNGKLSQIGNSNEVVDSCADLMRNRYLEGSVSANTVSDIISIKYVTTINSVGNSVTEIDHGDTIFVKVSYTAVKPIDAVVFGISITTSDQICVSALHTGLDDIYIEVKQGQHEIIVEYPKVSLLSGTYFFDVGFFEERALAPYCYIGQAASIRIRSPFFADGLLVLEHRWHVPSS